jgi:hypothetical protein
VDWEELPDEWDWLSGSAGWQRFSCNSTSDADDRSRDNGPSSSASPESANCPRWRYGFGIDAKQTPHFPNYSVQRSSIFWRLAQTSAEVVKR